MSEMSMEVEVWTRFVCAIAQGETAHFERCTLSDADLTASHASVADYAMARADALLTEWKDRVTPDGVFCGQECTVVGTPPAPPARPADDEALPPERYVLWGQIERQYNPGVNSYEDMEDMDDQNMIGIFPTLAAAEARFNSITQ